MKQIQTTFALGLILFLNCCSNAGASTSVSTGTTDSASQLTNPTSQNLSDSGTHEGSAPEVLLTIKGPAKVEQSQKRESGQELIEQTAKEDHSVRTGNDRSTTTSAASNSNSSATFTSAPSTQTPTLKNLRAGNTQRNALSNAPRQIAQRTPMAPGEFGLSSMAIQLAKQWNIYNRLGELDSAYSKFDASPSTDNTIQYLLSKQRVLADLTDVSFDVRRCTNAVDREIAKNSSKAAYLTELRDKAIRFNTYADFVAGGLTGIIAGALEMADLSRFANTSVDISEGIGQAGLSAWAFKAEHAGDRRQGGLPNILAAVIDPAYRHEAYPESVRAFLNTPSPDSPSGISRLDAMLERWEKLNFCLTHTGHRMKKAKRVKNLTGTHQEDATATIDLLEDRTAMLHDLRAEVTMMDEAVAEMFDYVKKH